MTKRVIIELDGKIHQTQQAEDRSRTFNLNMRMFKVIRFTNEEVYNNPQQVANQIKAVLDNQPDFIIADHPNHEYD